MEKKNNISRRSFLKNSALVGVAGTLGTTGGAAILSSCSGGSSSEPKSQPLERW